MEYGSRSQTVVLGFLLYPCPACSIMTFLYCPARSIMTFLYCPACSHITLLPCPACSVGAADRPAPRHQQSTVDTEMNKIFSQFYLLIHLLSLQNSLNIFYLLDL